MTVVAITRDLMDRSKITGAIPEARVIRPGGDMAGATVVLVDLSTGALAEALSSGARVIAYGSHVDEASLGAAEADGADAMPRSRFFRRLADGTLLEP